MQFKKKQLELDLKQQTGSKLGKEYVKSVYCHHAFLPCMQSTSCETLSWMKHKLELGCWEKYQQPQEVRYADGTTLMAESKEKLKILLMRVREESEKVDLKLNIKNNRRSWHLVPSLQGK